jgi:Zn-dependent protease with chaperone function
LLVPETKRTLFPGISADAYTTEADRKALAALESVPLLPAVLRKFADLGLDRWFYCMNMAMAVRCGPKQYPTLYRILQESCEVLDVAEPELYLTSNPFPNAFAGGVERPFVTLRNSIVDTLTDEELYHLIGHELGHIKAGHMLYRMVGRILVPLLQALGRRLPILGDAAALGLVFAFYEWIRQSELSCDRAGLLVAQDLSISMHANLALTSGPNRFAHEESVEAFMEQARSYQEAQPLDQIGKIILYFTSSWAWTHPMPVYRAQQLEQWSESGEYRKILHGLYPRSN